MRHSSIVLTMDTYGHLFPGQEADTVARLDNLTAGPPEAHAATGTDDARPAQRYAQRAGRETVRSDATAGDATTPKASRKGRRGPSPKAATVAKLCDVVQRKATPNKERRARDLNPQPVTRHHISSVAASHSLTLRRNDRGRRSFQKF
jgi:hypothetical protein